MKTCQLCGSLFKTHVVIDGIDRHISGRKYCLSCSPFGTHNTRVLKEGNTVECAKCGKIVRERRNKYCQECSKSHSYVIIESVEDAKTDPTRRGILIKEFGNKCMSCGNDKWIGRDIPLELDHIDGDSGNNAKSNLRLLCPNCHALTPTYKGRNRGSGNRSARSKYYKPALIV